MTEDIKEGGLTEVEYLKLPNGWQWWNGDRSSSYYTRWFGTNYLQGGDLVGKYGSMGGFEGEVYWDKGGEHYVHIYPILDATKDDPVVSEYPAISRSYETEEEAVKAVPRLIGNLKDE